VGLDGIAKWLILAIQEFFFEFELKWCYPIAHVKQVE
jgi:hypothetical protein